MHNHGKTYYEDLLDNATSVFTIFNGKTEVEQQSGAIIRENQCHEGRREPLENRQNLFSITTTALLHTE